MVRAFFVCLLVGFGLAGGAPAAAETYPTRVITLVVPFPAGGATDVVGRTLAQGLSERLGQQVIVENRPGANGQIGSVAVAQAKPDGYTLLMGGVNTQGMNDVLYKNRRYDSLKDFTPIALTSIIPVAFVVHPTLPANSLQDLVKLAKEQPGKLSYGSSGAGGPHNLAMELFKSIAAVDIQHIPYKGGAPQLNDLVAGHIKIGAIGLPPALQHIQQGRLRAVALTDGKRTSFLPDLPTVAESGYPGFEVNYWLGLFGPAGMPKDVVARLNKETVDILKQPAVRETLAKQGVEIVTSTPDELGSLVAKEIERWGKVVKDAGIALD
jgi:tripartite-type tricarboxylate transporter receptor subunit TctC